MASDYPLVVQNGVTESLPRVCSIRCFFTERVTQKNCSPCRAKRCEAEFTALDKADASSSASGLLPFSSVDTFPNFRPPAGSRLDALTRCVCLGGLMRVVGSGGS